MSDARTRRPSRNTSRAILVKDGHILLIERWRDGLHYFSIPGGGIESNETPEQTVVRELAEETTLEVKPVRCVYEMRDGDTTHYFYLCEYVNGEPQLPPESEEAQAGPNNRFKPQWIAVENISGLTFNYWLPVQKLLITDLINGFDKNVKVTTDE